MANSKIKITDYMGVPYILCKKCGDKLYLDRVDSRILYITQSCSCNNLAMYPARPLIGQVDVYRYINKTGINIKEILFKRNKPNLKLEEQVHTPSIYTTDVGYIYLYK